MPPRSRPRKLIDYVCARVGATSGDKCISQRSFYRVRRVLASAAGANARQIRPGTPVEDLLPGPTRRKDWPGVASQIGVRRSLRRPRWVVWSIMGLCGVAFFAAFRTSPAVHVLAGLAAAGCLGGALALVTAPLAVRLNMTAGDLARAAIPAVLAADEVSGRPQWTREAVAETCRLLIRDQLGLGEFSDDADFIRDLGLD